MDIIPVITVINRFFVLNAAIKQGIAASKFLFASLTSTVSPGIRIAGTNKADNTAAGICFSHLINHSGILTLESSKTGRTLGRYVTILIAIIIRTVFRSIAQ